MTKDEKSHLQRVADLGCIVCRNVYFRKTAAEIHHIRATTAQAATAWRYTRGRRRGKKHTARSWNYWNR